MTINRRKFLKNSILATSSMLILPSVAFCKSNNSIFGITSTPRKFSVKNTYKLKDSKEETTLWIPLPFTASYQKVLDIAYKGNYDEAKIVKNAYFSDVLFVKWNKNKKQRNLELNFSVITQNRTTDFSKAKNSMNYPKDIKVFLEGTTHIPVNKKIKEFTQEIIKDAKTPLQKAKAIYDWTVFNMYRDPDVVGCGIGDAARAIEKKLFGGKCTDISSVFVALLRNANIPAREAFGIRLGKSSISKACGKADKKGFANITTAQHCRAEFYIDGIGWIPADPADVTKVRLAEKLNNKDKKFQDTKEYMFGAWEMNWVAFNWARDFVLNPKPQQYPLNMLGYPYGENGEDVLNYYSPKDFAYTYTSQEKI